MTAIIKPAIEIDIDDARTLLEVHYGVPAAAMAQFTDQEVIDAACTRIYGVKKIRGVDARTVCQNFEKKLYSPRQRENAR